MVRILSQAHGVPTTTGSLESLRRFSPYHAVRRTAWAALLRVRIALTVLIAFAAAVFPHSVPIEAHIEDTSRSWMPVAAMFAAPAPARGYIDAVYGFSIVVPGDWEVVPATPDRRGSVTRLSKGGLIVEMGVFSTDKPTDVALIDWARPESNTVFDPGAQTQYRLGSLGALRQDFSDTQRSGSLLLASQDTKVYFVSVSPQQATSVPDVQVILSSFEIPKPYRLVQPVSTRLNANSDPRPGTVNSSDSTRRAQAPSGYRLPFVGGTVITTGPGCSATHKGQSSEAIDFAIGSGTNVYATQAGQIVYATYGWNDGFGNLLKIRHSDGNTSWYAHLDSFQKTSGDVNFAEHVAKSGTSGNSTGPHLHFEVRNSGNQSIWVRDLAGIRWFSGNANSPCQASGKPDGEATGPPLSPPPPAGSLEVTRRLELSGERGVNQGITATFTVKNNGNAAIPLQRLLAAGRGPNCQGDWRCRGRESESYADFPTVAMTLQPGQEYAYREKASRPKAGEYFAEAIYQHGDGSWHGISGANRVGYTIVGGNETVPFFSQRDSRWAGTLLGYHTQSPYTIGNYGCFITSLSMLFNRYRPDFTDPGRINEALKAPNVSGFVRGGELVWDSTSAVAPPGIRYIGSTTDTSRVDQELAAGRPVLADVYSTATDQHMVIIFEKSNGNYLFKDPGDATDQARVWPTGALSGSTGYSVRVYRLFSAS